MTQDNKEESGLPRRFLKIQQAIKQIPSLEPTEELRVFIEETQRDIRIAGIPPKRQEEIYREARKRALLWRRKNPSLPELPKLVENNPLTGLDTIIEWCDLAGERKNARTNEEQKGKAKSRIKPPSKEEIQFYLLSHSFEFQGKKQTELARIMSTQLKRKVKDWEITRWKQHSEKWQKLTGLPITNIITKPDEIATDPDKIDMGKREDGIVPRQRLKKSTDDDSWTAGR